MTDTPKQPATDPMACVKCGQPILFGYPHDHTPKQPATEAGRALYEHLTELLVSPPTKDRILAIEAEAAAGLLALREALEYGVKVVGTTYPTFTKRAEAALADTAPAAAEIEARNAVVDAALAWSKSNPPDRARLDFVLRGAVARYEAALREQPATACTCGAARGYMGGRHFRDCPQYVEQPATDEAQWTPQWTPEQLAEVRRIAYLADDIERRRQADELAEGIE